MAVVLFLRILVNQWTAFWTANNSRCLMCSFDSTCDHLPLADLSPNLNRLSEPYTDYVSLGPLFIGGSVHHFTNSLFSTKAGDQQGMYSTQVHSCLEIFAPSLERDSMEILVVENIVILSAGSINRNSTAGTSIQTSVWVADDTWKFFKFRWNPAWSKMSKTILVWEINCPLFRDITKKSSK